MTSDRMQRRIDAFLDEAEQGMVQGDWATVQDRARKVLLLDKANKDAQTFLAAAEEALRGGPLSPAPSTGSGQALCPERGKGAEGRPAGPLLLPNLPHRRNLRILSRFPPPSPRAATP